MEYLKVAFLILLAVAVIVYLRLRTLVSKIDRVLETWAKIEETSFVGSFVGPIFTMLLKMRNPYSRSIGFVFK
jgi:hypothetical protein